MKFLCAVSVFFIAVFDVNSFELTVKVLDPQQQAVSDIVVYLSPSDQTQDLQINTNPLIIDQKDKKFSPYITVMQKGQSINFVNHDDITHHIYSVSGENRFEFKIKADVKKVTKPMKVSEEIAMGCNIHDWMSGYVMVVNTPYFGKTDELGQVTLTLPQKGNYVITAWHPQLDTEKNSVIKSVNIDRASLNMSISLPKNLLPIPKQTGQDEFDFIEEY